MQVQLIHPPVYVNPKALTALTPAPPLGLAYIAAALEKHGHAVSVIDALAEAPEQTARDGDLVRLGLSPEQIVERIDGATRVVGLTNMWSFSWPVVRELIHCIKARRPEVTLVCGGEHFSGMAERSMQTAPIDYIVTGEGEDTAVELFGMLERRLALGESFDARRIAGLVWRDGDAIVVNPRRDRIKNVDEIPWPAWHLFDLDTYNAHGMKTGIDYGYMVPMLATRGCPYQCTYCSSPQMWTTRWITRSPAKVADELEHWVEEYGANNFPLQDLTAIIRRDWILEFCDEIIRRRLDIRWQLPSGTRCEAIDEEVCARLYESGCRTLCFAPESASEDTRQRVKKRMKSESLFRAIDAAAKYGINMTCFIMFGIPGDRDEHVRQNIAFARKLALHGVEDVSCCFFFPLPGTPLYDEVVEKGRMGLEDDVLLAPIATHARVIDSKWNFSEHISTRRLNFYKWLTLWNFYPLSFLTHPRRVLRIARNLVRGVEESKLESFIRISLTQRLNGLLRRFGRARLPSGGRGSMRRALRPAGAGQSLSPVDRYD